MAVDLGTGDGRFVVSRARADAKTLFVGLDANVAGMAEASRKAPPNVLFARGAVEALPAELDGLAAEITVNFPWGSLFAAVVHPDERLLAGIRRLCLDEATLTVTTSIDLARDAAMLGEIGLPFQADHLPLVEAAYGRAGFALVAFEELGAERARGVGTTWAKRLAAGGGRRHWRLSFRAVSGVIR